MFIFFLDAIGFFLKLFTSGAFSFITFVFDLSWVWLIRVVAFWVIIVVWAFIDGCAISCVSRWFVGGVYVAIASGLFVPIMSFKEDIMSLQ